MLKSISISVVVPVFNNANFLVNTLVRLVDFLSERYSDFEIIFVDDSSKDNSAEFLKSAAATYAFVHVISHSKNLGQQQSIADGALSAKGEILLIVDADLPCEDSDLQLLVDTAVSGPELVLARRAVRADLPVWRHIASRMANFLFRRIYRYDIRDFGCGIAAVRRALIEKFRAQGLNASHIKLDVLLLASDYREIEIRGIPETNSSSYTFAKLAGLFWILITHRWSRARKIRCSRPTHGKAKCEGGNP